MNELAVYECHKRVRATRVYAAHTDREGSTRGQIVKAVFLCEHGTIEFTKAEAARIGMAFETRANPKDLGYLVYYEDGYVSWSPAAAFEAGYHHAMSPDTYRPHRSRNVRAWRNTLAEGDEMPSWVLGASMLQFNVPETGHITVESKWVGTHVCEPGHWLCMSDEGDIMAIGDAEFKRAYEPEATT